jgi:hypothetical protein
MLTLQERTREINRLQRRHPKTRRQRNYHGAERYSVEFFSKATGKLVASYRLLRRRGSWPLPQTKANDA